MANITSRIRRLSQVVAEATVAVLGTGKVAGAEITAAAGLVTVPAGSRIAFGRTGTRPPQAIELTEDVDVSAVNGDELYVRQLPGGASFEIVAAAATPVGALKLADLSGTPVDTVVDTSPAEIGAVDAKEVSILDAAANYAAATVEAALAEIAPQLGVGTDADAIHDNVAAEISAVAEKAAPISADLLLIEDSAAGNAKKRAQIGNLPSSAVAKAYLHARVDEQTTDLLVNDHVEFDVQSIVDASGDISLAVGAGQLAGLITLAAGKVYEVTAGIRADFSAAGGVVRFRLRDNTGAVEFGNQSELFARSGTSHVHTLAIATGIIAPSVTTEIELRITAVVSLTTIRGINAAAGQSFIKVVEIG